MTTAQLFRVVVPATVMAGSAALVLGGLPAQAGASTISHPAQHDPTAVFTYTGVEQTFVVPAGVTSVTVSAIGAAGQSTTGGVNAGGLGASVFSTFGVIPGQILYVEVGGTGALGGFNGGAAAVATGGAGGGASDVRTIPRASVGTLGSRLVVAGGGGGAGADGTCGAGTGGNGGNQATAGDPGLLCVVASSGGGGGGAGTDVAGGSVGTAGAGATGGNPGTVGSLGAGGPGGTSPGAASDGGGGGGGVFGGGGGGGGGLTVADVGAGGGGGGGSSMGTSLGSTAAAAEVDITYSTSSTLAISTSSPLPGGTVGHAYSKTLTATGGTGGYTWALIPGSTLNAGLSLSTGGVISGTPTANFTRTFTIEVTDSALNTADKTFSLTIGAHGTPGDLSVLLSHDGHFRHDHRGTYKILVANTGTTTATAMTSVSLLLPSGITVVHGGSGTFWQCHKHAHSSFCSRNAKISAHSSTTISVTVRITASVGNVLKAKAVVTPSDSTESDNTDTDIAIVRS